MKYEEKKRSNNLHINSVESYKPQPTVVFGLLQKFLE